MKTCACYIHTINSPNLKLLSINYHNFSQAEFEQICETCSRLEMLEIFMLEHEWLTQDIFFDCISQLKHLKGLQIEYPRFDANMEFFVELNQRVPNLNILCAWWWTVKTDHVHFIINQFKHLTDLALAFCDINPFKIEKFIISNKQTKITRFGYQGANIRSNPKLERLRIRADSISNMFEQYNGVSRHRYVPILTDSDVNSEN